MQSGNLFWISGLPALSSWMMSRPNTSYGGAEALCEVLQCIHFAIAHGRVHTDEVIQVHWGFWNQQIKLSALADKHCYVLVKTANANIHKHRNNCAKKKIIPVSSLQGFCPGERIVIVLLTWSSTPPTGSAPLWLDGFHLESSHPDLVLMMSGPQTARAQGCTSCGEKWRIGYVYFLFIQLILAV